LLHRFVSGLPDKLLAVATDRYLYYWSNHFKAYMFWATKGMLIAHIIASFFVGCIVALAAKGREMAATMTLGFVLGAMTAAGLFVLLANTGDTSFLWILAFQCADSLAIVSGGAIVRMRRSVATTRPSIT
jgi:predicted permease